MEHKDNKNNLFLLTIVAIVAIVGIVIMIASTGSRTEYLSQDAISLEDNVGQATKGTVSTELNARGRTSYNLIDQTIPLSTGWNYISLNVKPESLDIKYLMSPLVEEGSLDLIKNNAGVTYWPAKQIYDLKTLDLQQGYMIRVNMDTKLTVSGKAIALPFNVPLNTGWNMMPYPAQNPAKAMDVVADLKNSGVLVKVQDEKGNAIVNLPGIGWVDYIKEFRPGEAYMINVNQDARLIIKDEYKPVTECIDSDGGSIYDVRGTTTVSYRTARDYCRAYSSSTLVEYYCNLGRLSYKDYKCPNGCKDGACIKLAYCGNSVIDQNEQCDGANLGGSSCASLGNNFIGGTLTCMPPRSQSECSFNTGDCKALKVQVLSTSITLSTALDSLTYTQGDTVYITWTANQNMANYLRYIGLTNADDTSIQLNIETSEELVGLSGKHSWEIPSYLPAGRYYVEVGAQPRGPGSMYAKSQVFTVVAKSGCGNGIIDPGEQCDGKSWGKVYSCTDFGFTGGTLSCYPAQSQNQCSFDIRQCTMNSAEAVK